MASQQASSDRPYDIVVWGASGFTGSLVVDYLVQRVPAAAPLRWAVAGRDAAKVEAVLRHKAGNRTWPDVLTANSDDLSSLQALAGSAHVIVSTVGPYALYGEKLVQACAANGTHYCDLAGEVQWIRRMIDRYQVDAEDSGARLVNCCGFDSIPSDLGVQCLQEKAQEEFGEPCTRIELLVKALKGTGSGGTIASALNALRESRDDREVARILVQPYSLNPDGERRGPDGRDQSGPRYSDLAGAWTAPFIMAIINMRIVRRSNALLGYPYGREFRYSEATLTGAGTAGWLKGAGMAAGLGGMLLAASFSATRRWLVEPLVPRPGEGPNATTRDNGFFSLLLIGETADGRRLRLRVKGDRDPGYGSTSRMLGESALCLATDTLAVGGGLWTPASAMGRTLRERLVRNAGLSFTFD